MIFRKATFYKKHGWKEVGTHGDDEIKMEMTSEVWKQQKSLMNKF